jgi:hypothetical protein
MCSRNASPVRGLFCFTAVSVSINSSSLAFASSNLQNSFSLEVVLSQDVVHAPCPYQFLVCVGHKKVATATLEQAGVEVVC